MRGRNVSVAKSTIRYLQNMETESSLTRISNSASEETMINARGYVAGLRRVLFAFENWQLFESSTPATILEPFSFSYVRLKSSPLDYSAIRKKIKKSESEVIRQLAPVCNKETPLFQGRSDVTLEEFMRSATNSLQ